MKEDVFPVCRKWTFVLSLSVILSLFSSSVYAAEGCNPTVREAMERRSEALVAVDKSNMDQTIEQPVSVLMQTCFNQSAGVSALEGGAIFSGDFTSDATPIIESALESMYTNFDDALNGFFAAAIAALPPPIPSLAGGLFAVFGGTSTTALEPTYDCTGIENLWDAVKTEGIQEGIAYPLMSEILSGTVPAGAGDKFTESFNASNGKNVFSDFNAAMAAVPAPVVPSFAGAVTLCDALIIAGIAATCP